MLPNLVNTLIVVGVVSETVQPELPYEREAVPTVSVEPSVTVLTDILVVLPVNVMVADWSVLILKP